MYDCICSSRFWIHASRTNWSFFLVDINWWFIALNFFNDVVVMFYLVCEFHLVILLHAWFSWFENRMNAHSQYLMCRDWGNVWYMHFVSFLLLRLGKQSFAGFFFLWHASIILLDFKLISFFLPFFPVLNLKSMRDWPLQDLGNISGPFGILHSLGFPLWIWIPK